HHVFRPDNTVQILEVGAAIPWHASALGHAIVANLPASARGQALAGGLSPLTGRTKTTRGALSRALAAVRTAGYAVENEEATVGDAGIAAPILGRDDLAAGAIGVVGSGAPRGGRDRRRRLGRPAAGGGDPGRPRPRGRQRGPRHLPRPRRRPRRRRPHRLLAICASQICFTGAR